MSGIALFVFTSVLAVSAMTSVALRPAIAGGDEAEAKAICQTIGAMLKDPNTNIEAMKTFISNASNQGMSKDAIDAIAGYVGRLTTGVTVIEGPLFLTAKNYDDVLHRAWFLLVRNGRPIYMECESVKTQGQWEFTHFDLETNRDKIPLP